MRRQRPRLDLLPLLDVFMVVLFVFATIQEQRLEMTTHAAETQRLRSQELAVELGRTQVELVAERAEQERLRDEEVVQLRERLTERDATLAKLRRDAREAAAAHSSAEDPIRRRDVLTKLLDRYTVFEIEIAGELGPEGVINHCCFRDDPLSETWQRCGQVPAPERERAQWFDDGAEGLLDALRRTKGGNAMTIIRQDENATYRIATGLETLLRERIGDHQIYDEGVGLVAITCAP